MENKQKIAGLKKFLSSERITMTLKGRIMAKSKREIQKEIYEYVEERYLEAKNPVILQDILNKFCDKYKVSEPTITRILDEMVAKKNPFRLRTWYDKNRYYCIPTVSVEFQVSFILTFVLSIVAFIMNGLMELPVNMFHGSIFFFSGYWLATIVRRMMDDDSRKKKNKFI